MYTLTIDGRPLFDPRLDDYKLEAPTLNQQANRLSTLTFSIYPNHGEYGAFEKLKSDIMLYADGDRLARFRPVYSKAAMRGGVNHKCEELAARLNDFQRRPGFFHGSPAVYLAAMLDDFNARNTDGDVVFKPGDVLGADPEELDFINDDYMGYWDLLIDSLPGKYGGYLIPRYEADAVYLDFLQEAFLPLSEQKIVFGENLADTFLVNDAASAFSVLIPLGANVPAEDIQEGQAEQTPLTIKSVNDGKDYLLSEAGRQLFGWREKVVSWPDIEDAGELLTEAQKYLAENAVKMADSATLTAVDLHNTGADIAAFRALQRVSAQCPPLGLSAEYVTAKMTIPLGAPKNTKIQVGTLKGGFTQKAGEAARANAVTVQRVEKRIIETNVTVKKYAEETDKAISKINNTLQTNSKIINATEANITGSLRYKHRHVEIAAITYRNENNIPMTKRFLIVP